MTEFWRRIPRHHLIRAAYLAAGLKIGSLWLLQGDSSPVEHAVRLIALLAAVMLVAELVRRAAARRGRQVPHHPIGRFLLAKVALVGLALVAGLALDDLLAHAELWVGAGLILVVSLAGPRIHPWLVKADRPPSGRAGSTDQPTDQPALAAL
ncbi:MAG: hypothetical protein SW019_16490 [Actinomycetota bacterium]|nr:hypothetical protein [Actinomycetota bacterium]